MKVTKSYRWFIALVIVHGVIACGPSEPAAKPLAESPKDAAVSAAPLEASPSVSASDDNPNRIYQTSRLEKVMLNLPKGKVEAWIMDDFGKRQEGMMFLTEKEVRTDQGMLFLFKDIQFASDQRAFWMHNTLLPLDIIYIGANGKVVSIGDGKPQSDTPVPPKGDYQFVLELRGGEAERFGIREGTAIPVPKTVSAKD